MGNIKSKYLKKRAKLDNEQEQLSQEVDAIYRTSAVGQAPLIYHKTLEKLLKVQKEKATIWNEIRNWPGGYIQSLEARTHGRRAGKGIVWLTNTHEMVEGQQTADFVKLMGMVDTANGVVSRQDWPFQFAFPNLDLQIHLYRMPKGKWLGLETVQQYGDDGIGLTSSVLHDETGPFGRSEQILTLRQIG